MSGFFPGFEERFADVADGVRLRYRAGGSGGRPSSCCTAIPARWVPRTAQLGIRQV